MCFSAPASFTAAAVLLPAGVYSIVKAVAKDKRYLLFASVPVIFAIQQFAEGMAWYYHGTQQLFFTQLWAYVYLFFAYAFWPYFISLSMYQIESTTTWRKKALRWFVWAGGALGVIIYLPILLTYVPLHVYVDSKSIVYDTYGSNMIVYIYAIAYALILMVPMYISSAKGMLMFGVLISASFVIALVWYFYAFTSVWCFFAAVWSVYVASVLHDIKRNGNSS